MKNPSLKLVSPFLLLFICFGGASAATSSTPQYVLTDIQLAARLKLSPIAVHETTGTVMVRVTESQRSDLAHEAHDMNRCGGHELLTEIKTGASIGQAKEYAQKVFETFDRQMALDREFENLKKASLTYRPTVFNADIKNAVNLVSEQNLRTSVDLLSKFPSRNHKSNDAKSAVLAFKTHIESTLRNSKIPFQIDLISHQSTPMSSLRLKFLGATRPQEIVVAGGHIDSINGSFFGSKSAPGVDDNASGSANLLEAARIISESKQPDRTIEIYWYAGEEGGLLGSQEIAKSAKDSQRKIMGVLQLDMTLFPGDGEFTLGSMTDFTSLEMRNLLSEINRDYIGAKIIEDKCGYGCSDHASWYKNGFPTLMPFEATMKRMNRNIHTDKDTVSASLSFRHSGMFSKIAVAFLMTLSAQ